MKPGDKEASLIIAYKSVFGSDLGQQVLADMCESAFVLHGTFSDNPYEMAHKEGQREVVLRILTTLELEPSRVRELIQKEMNDESIDYTV